LSRALGLEIARYEKGTILIQIKYTLKLLKDTENLATEPSPTPHDTSIKLHIRIMPLMRTKLNL